MNLSKGLYHDACAQVCHDGSWRVITKILAGVLQGCPGSVFFFHSARDALDASLFSMDMAYMIAFAGIARACADDIRATRGRLYPLKLLQPIFLSAKELAGLSLKPSKKAVWFPCVSSALLLPKE